jgi:hypothetical protein
MGTPQCVTSWLTQGSVPVQEVAAPRGRASSKEPVGFFTGSQKPQRRVPRGECPWDSDSESDVISSALRPLEALPWDEAQEPVTVFQVASRFIMEGNWMRAATCMQSCPDACRVSLPTGEPGAGYGLIHTLCTKNAPDWMTDWVINRTPMEILCLLEKFYWGKPPPPRRLSVLELLSSRPLSIR